MTMTDTDRYPGRESASVADRARRLILAATGEPWGDGDRVTDLTHDYAEPGYTSDAGVVVFGNWNPARFQREGDAPLSKSESIGPRLARALESIGADLAWSDEWTTCEGCQGAFRTVEDSYSWRMAGTYDENGAYCADCLRGDMETAVESYLNDPSRCITWGSPADLIGIGFDQYPPDADPYESGWHGQTDDPRKVYDGIRSELGTDVEVVFLLDESSQFYCRWSAYVRTPED